MEKYNKNIIYVRLCPVEWKTPGGIPVFFCYSVKLVSFFNEINDSEPDFALEPEDSEDRGKDEEGAEHHIVGAVGISDLQKAEVDGGEDAEDQVSHEDDAPDEDAGEGFGLLGEKGGEDAGIGPVLLVGVGIPCHGGTSLHVLVVGPEFLPEEKFKKGEE